MKPLRARSIIALLAVIAIISMLVLLYARGTSRSTFHFWGSVVGWIEYDGRALANPKVYLGNPDLLLVDLKQEENAVYVIDLKSREITELHGYDYRNASSLPPTEPKILSPDVAVEPYTVKFTSSKKARVHVSWALNM